MLATAALSAHNASSVQILTILIAIVVVVFWKTALKLAILILVAALIALLGSGAYVLIYHVHHVVR